MPSVTWHPGFLTPDALMKHWRPGSYDNWTWDDEEKDILAIDKEYQAALEAYILENGFPGSVILGNDGRVWDGHHRIIAAKRLGSLVIPVELARRGENERPHA